MEPSISVPAAAGGSLNFIYLQLLLGAIIAVYLVMKHRTPYRLELVVIAFFLLTGEYNFLLKFKIPGISFFEIQPGRFIFLLFLFFWGQKLLTSGLKRDPRKERSIPAFKSALYLCVGSIVLSQLMHLEKVGFSEVVVQAIFGLTFIIIIETLQVIGDEVTFGIIGRAVIIGAVFSSVISLIQVGYDPSFMRVGDSRGAFGDVIRANGMFWGEYTNGYFLIIATIWSLTLLKNKFIQGLLVGLFTLAIFTTFHRMSWLVLIICLSIYFFMIKTPALDRLILAALLAGAVLLTGTLLFYRDIAHSSLVKERLNDSVEGREGYWSMVFNHIGEKPIFGFGNSDNEVYYTNMLRVTRERDRATGASGDLHNGYLQIMFINGIPSFIFFTAFVILCIFYFGKWLGSHLYFAIPFLFSIVYLFANMTNNFTFNKHMALLCAIHIGVGMGIKHSFKLKSPLASAE